ncbi:hypothetical protein LTR05_001909 [Lithohypha guttulata]|uniref:F-box domain-containing protein n=1 Tax=Lithohypha guttulata TaxID=1690604 RepID=A0AAN7TF29_9EURO|nr:hypothetical protein LTR05_001909 [Lithohypha guttulata]
MSRNNEIHRSMLTELLEGQPARKKQRTTSAAPVSTLMLDGQRAFEEKRFEAAIHHFTRVIDNLDDGKADLLHIYELRSSAYTRLEKLDLALKDAKQMIRLDRSDCRGYLRCAQVELLRNNASGAAKVCELGVKSVSLSDGNRRRVIACLLRAQEALKQKVIFDKGTDPLAVLPSELLAMVLSTLGYREIVAIMRVSKSWRTRLCSTDLITQTIDTREARRTVTYEQIKTAFSRLGKSPKSMALSKLNGNAARLVSSELGHWIRWESLHSLTIDDGKISLRSLRFDKLGNLQELCIRCPLPSGKSLKDILSCCRSLRCLRLHDDGFDNHESFTLNHGHEYKNLQTLIVAQHKRYMVDFKLPEEKCIFPNLEHFGLTGANVLGQLDLSTYTKLKHLCLRNVHISEHDNLRTPPSLEAFTLEGHFANIFPNPEEIKFPTNNLTTINTTGEESIRFLAYAIRQGLNKAKFRTLSISNFITNNYVAGRHMENNLDLLLPIPGNDAFHNVESLTLRDDNLKNSDWSTVAKLFPAVKHLQLESPQLTEEFVSELVKSQGDTCETVVLINCTAVSQSIIPWMKARCIDVKLVRSASQVPETIGGTTVRYGN